MVVIHQTQESFHLLLRHLNTSLFHLIDHPLQRVRRVPADMFDALIEPQNFFRYRAGAIFQKRRAMAPYRFAQAAKKA